MLVNSKKEKKMGTVQYKEKLILKGYGKIINQNNRLCKLIKNKIKSNKEVVKS